MAVHGCSLALLSDIDCDCGGVVFVRYKYKDFVVVKSGESKHGIGVTDLTQYLEARWGRMMPTTLVPQIYVNSFQT